MNKIALSLRRRAPRYNSHVTLKQVMATNLERESNAARQSKPVQGQKEKSATEHFSGLSGKNGLMY